MMCFGTSVNDELENTYETGILVCFNDMYEDKRRRHVDSFLKYRCDKARKRFPDLLPDFEEKLKARWETRRLRPWKKFLTKIGKE